MENQNAYAKPVTLKNILAFAVPTIAMTVFMLFTMILLPLLLGVNGIWLATPVAECMALALSALMFVKYRNRYQYG